MLVSADCVTSEVNYRSSVRDSKSSRTFSFPDLGVIRANVPRWHSLSDFLPRAALFRRIRAEPLQELLGHDDRRVTSLHRRIIGRETAVNIDPELRVELFHELTVGLAKHTADYFVQEPALGHRMVDLHIFSVEVVRLASDLLGERVEVLGLGHGRKVGLVELEQR